MPDLLITAKEDAAQKAVLGAASLEACSPWLRHMEEIEGDLMSRARFPSR
jgi:hypothetical protein